MSIEDIAAKILAGDLDPTTVRPDQPHTKTDDVKGGDADSRQDTNVGSAKGRSAKGQQDGILATDDAADGKPTIKSEDGHLPNIKAVKGPGPDSKMDDSGEEDDDGKTTQKRVNSKAPVDRQQREAALLDPTKSSPDSEEDDTDEVDAIRDPNDSVAVTEADEDEDDEDEDEKNAKAKKLQDDDAALDLDIAVKEAFASFDISEAMLAKFQTLFASAVSAKVAGIRRAAEAAIETRVKALTAKQTKATEDLNEQTNDYLKYVGQKWLAENRLAAESGMKAHMFDSFMGDLVRVLEQYHVTTPEKVDILDQMKQDLDTTKATLNKLQAENVDLVKKTNAQDRVDAFRTISEGLSDEQKAKFSDLVSEMKANDVAQYTERATLIKEQYFTTDTSKVAKQIGATPGQVVTESADNDADMDFFVKRVLHADRNF